MNIIRDRHFEDQEVILDHIQFRDCTFVGCTLIFHGHGHSDFEECKLEDCSFSFQEQASRTLDFLRSLAGTGFSIVVFQVARQLLGGPDLRLVDIGDERRLVLDSGPVPADMEEETLDALLEISGDEVQVWTAEASGVPYEEAPREESENE